MTDVLSSVLQADIENLRQISMDEDRDTFQTAVEKIVHARHIYIFGRAVLYPSGGLPVFLYADDL